MTICPTRLTALIFIFSSSLLASGCRTLQEVPAPSSFAVDTSEAKQVAEAQDFAQNLVSEKKNKDKEPAGMKPQVEPSKPVAIADPTWESIRKQKVKTEKALTLTELIDMALKKNPQTRRIWENTRIARAIQKQSESELYPQLNISEAVTREKQITSAVKFNDLHYGPSAQLTYLLLDFGGRDARIESTFQKVLEANSLYNQSFICFGEFTFKSCPTRVLSFSCTPYWI